MVERGAESQGRRSARFRRRGFTEGEPSSRATVLSREYLHASAQRQLGAFWGEGDEDQRAAVARSLEQFVDQRVTGVRLHGVDVISIDFTHNQTEVDPRAKIFLHSPSTSVIVAENFGPDVKTSKLHQKFWKFAERDSTGLKQTIASRFAFADQLAEVCAKANKPVAVAEIANKLGQFTAVELGFRATTSLPAAYEVGSRTIIDFVPDLYDYLPSIKPEWIPYVLSGANTIWLTKLASDSIRGKGMVDREKVSLLERIAPDFEHARRLSVASAIEVLTNDPRFAATDGDTPPQIVVMYPRAHTLRINDTLTKPEKKWDKVRRGVYKAVGTLGNLDFSLRLWEHKDGWENTQNIALP